MRLFTSLRTHPAVLATPFIGAFFFYVFLTSTRRIEQLIDLPWAAQAASYAAHAPVPMAAAAAAGLTAVEATRLKALGAWQLGSVRPTWRIALQPVLTTVACLSTLTAGVMAGGLWVVGVLPDLYALQLLAIVVVLITAHAVIGFVVGRHLHALYSAPLVAVVVFVGITFPLGTANYWAHHVTGAIDWVGFGEAYSPAMTERRSCPRSVWRSPVSRWRPCAATRSATSRCPSSLPSAVCSAPTASPRTGARCRRPPRGWPRSSAKGPHPRSACRRPEPTTSVRSRSSSGG
ncbi:hypothetical protein ACWGA4_18195 [Streptomyces rubiginosohelvolus]|uniref:hypothetical protein n=1 Tax=Streptomyces sp. CB02130 TaxID=1703934 RepID=UPI000B1B5729|nr:hypothetical protein [Streptomyces sp. CB02130]